VDAIAGGWVVETASADRSALEDDRREEDQAGRSAAHFSKGARADGET